MDRHHVEKDGTMDIIPTIREEVSGKTLDTIKSITHDKRDTAVKEKVTIILEFNITSAPINKFNIKT